MTVGKKLKKEMHEPQTETEREPVRGIIIMMQELSNANRLAPGGSRGKCLCKVA